MNWTNNRAVKTLKVVGVNLGILLCLLLSLELVLRLFHIGPEFDNNIIKQLAIYTTDKYLPFKPIPNSSAVQKNPEFEMQVKHNSMGFRDVEHSIRKPANTFRILGIGDSFTYGVGVPFEKSFLYRLENMLNSRKGASKRVEIIKEGIPRYWPEPERMVLEHYGLVFNPDLVLEVFLPNDVAETYFGLDAVSTSYYRYLVSKEGAKLGRFGSWLYAKSRLARIILKVYASRKRFDNNQIWKDNGPYEKEWLKIEDEFRKMIKLAQSKNAKLVIIHIPQRGPWYDGNSYPAQRFERFAKLNNAYFIDILPDMKKEYAKGGKKLYYDIDGHCTEEGYKVVADTVYRKLIQYGLVP